MKTILKNRTKILLLFCALSFRSMFANISITEIMQSNFGGVIDYYNEYPDSWVEIHNSGNQDVDLRGYSISEANNLDSAYTLPESLIVPADGYTLIFCDKQNIKQHTDFKLNTDKPGAIYLWDKHGMLADSIHYPEMISPEVSWGRLPDYPDSLSHFRIATPQKANNNTHCERVLKKVDFSVNGGTKKEAFFLKMSLKGDYPKDAVIRFTTDGSEPQKNSRLYYDSIYINKTTVIRAKPFSDSAISKISKTQTYFFDIDNKMPIINIVCDPDYLYSKEQGILSSSSKYAETHDNPPSRPWMGNENYLYNWRRPINVEYYAGDSAEENFNQLSETRVCGNATRTMETKSMVIYANKRFCDKHFNGAIWNHLKPNVVKQKSMSIRSSNTDPEIYALKDMLSQTAIGRFAKYYDVDFQAQRNVQFCINGEFKYIMHLQERDNDDFVWANHNKTSDIEHIETLDGLYEEGALDPILFPNYAHFKQTFESQNSTYQEMANLLDINAFMNYVSTQAYFGNIDFPYNNVALWYDKQGTKKWRWIMKDLDGTFYETTFPYYNFLLRKEPFENIIYANTKEACEVYIKMFSFEKFKQPYIDRTCALAGTAFSKNSINYMLDSLSNDMALALDASDLQDYLNELEFFYIWSEARQKFYTNNLSEFFGLGDTTQLTIRGLHNDSIVYFNNNPLMENKFDGYFFEGRDLYLTHDNKLDIYGIDVEESDDIKYLDFGKPIQTSDSMATSWTISYLYEDQRIVEHYSNENLHYKIPEGAKSINITDGYVGNGILTSEPTIASRSPKDLTYMVYSTSGVFVGKFNYDEISHYKQKDNINIVVVLDENGHKLYTLKLLKD